MFKRLFDLLGGCFGIMLMSPLLILWALAVRLTSRGPALFVQNRLGKNGRIFAMYKFRTMVAGAENMGTGLFSFADDPRITRVGRVLRKYSLDELPQLINVLNGTMSLVGPRPPVTYELGDYADFTPEMKVRFQVKPGITGLAQVSGRKDLTLDDMVRRDIYYIENWSPWQDLQILLRTLPAVLSGRGAY